MRKILFLALSMIALVSCTESCNSDTEDDPASVSPAVLTALSDFTSTFSVGIDDVVSTSTQEITSDNRETVRSRLSGAIQPATSSGSGSLVPMQREIFDWPSFEDFPDSLKQYFDEVIVEGSEVLDLEWQLGSGDSLASIGVVNSDGELVFDTLALFEPLTVDFAPHIPVVHGEERPPGPAAMSEFGVDTHSAVVRSSIDLLDRLSGENQYLEVLGSPLFSMAEGSVREDDGIRWLNHFIGLEWDDSWNTAPTKSVSPDMDDQARRPLVQKAIAGELREHLLGTGTVFPSSIEWAREQVPVDGTAVSTWDRAVELYADEATREQSFEALGHILHLMQDLGQPDHIAGRAHPGSGLTVPGLKRKIGGDSIIPFETQVGDVPPDAVGYERYWDMQTALGRLDEIASEVSDALPSGSDIETLLLSMRNQTETLASGVFPADGDDAMGLRSVSFLELIPAGWIRSHVERRGQKIEGVSIALRTPQNLVPSIDPSNPGVYDTTGSEIVKQVIIHTAAAIKLFYDIVSPPPRLDEVEVFQDGETKYSSTFDRGVIAESSVCVGQEASLELRFGPETLRSSFHPMDPDSIVVRLGSVGLNVIYNDQGQQPRVIASFTPSEPGQFVLSVDASDARPHYGDSSYPGTSRTGDGGARLDSNPSTTPDVSITKAPYRWSGYEPGADKNHSLTVVDCDEEDDEAQVAEGLSAVIVGLATYMSEDGAIKVVGEVENNGTVDIDAPKMTFEYLDSTGAVIESDSVGVVRQRTLSPGDRAPFRSGRNIDAVEVRVTVDENIVEAESPRVPLPVEFTDIYFTERFLAPQLNAPRTFESVAFFETDPVDLGVLDQAVVVWYDSDGTVIDVSESRLLDPSLPGFPELEQAGTGDTLRLSHTLAAAKPAASFAVEVFSNKDDKRWARTESGNLVLPTVEIVEFTTTLAETLVGVSANTYYMTLENTANRSVFVSGAYATTDQGAEIRQRSMLPQIMAPGRPVAVLDPGEQMSFVAWSLEWQGEPLTKEDFVPVANIRVHEMRNPADVYSLSFLSEPDAFTVNVTNNSESKSSFALTMAFYDGDQLLFVRDRGTQHIRSRDAGIEPGETFDFRVNYKIIPELQDSVVSRVVVFDQVFCVDDSPTAIPRVCGTRATEVE